MFKVQNVFPPLKVHADTG